MSELPTLDPVKLQGYTLDVDLYLKRDYSDIAVAAEELPALIEWINMMVQAYTEDKLVAKQEIKEAEAEAYKSLMVDDTIAKKTDSYISRMIPLDPDVKSAHRRYARLAGWVTRLCNLQLSFQSKLDLVRSTESTRRKLFTDRDDNLDQD